MGTIKDITDLLTKLIGNIKDRKLATELREIQTLINTLQSENTVLQEKNFALIKENSNLKTENTNLKKTIKDYEQKELEQEKQQDEVGLTPGETSEKILQQLFKAGQELPIQHFVSSLSLDISIVQYHFDILLEKGLIQLAAYGQPGNSLIDARFDGDSSTPDTFQITSKGRKYIVANNLT